MFGNDRVAVGAQQHAHVRQLLHQARVFAKEAGGIARAELVQVGMQHGGRYAPGGFQLAELVAQIRALLGAMLGLAQHAHDALAQLVECVVGMAAAVAAGAS